MAYARHSFGSKQFVGGLMRRKKEQKQREQEMLQDLMNASKTGTFKEAMARYDPQMLTRLRQENPGTFQGMEVQSQQFITQKKEADQNRSWKMANNFFDMSQKFDNPSKYGEKGKSTSAGLYKQGVSELEKLGIKVPSYIDTLEANEKKQALTKSIHDSVQADIEQMRTGDGNQGNKYLSFQNTNHKMRQLQKLMPEKEFKVILNQVNASKKMADQRITDAQEKAGAQKKLDEQRKYKEQQGVQKLGEQRRQEKTWVTNRKTGMKRQLPKVLADQLVQASPDWVLGQPTGKTGMAGQQMLTPNQKRQQRKDVLGVEEKILSNPDNPAVQAHIRYFNQNANAPYLFKWEKGKGGLFGGKGKAIKIDLPARPRTKGGKAVQITLDDIRKTMKEEKMTLDEVLNKLGIFE